MELLNVIKMKKLKKLFHKTKENELLEPLVFLSITVLIVSFLLATKVPFSTEGGTRTLAQIVSHLTPKFNLTVITMADCEECYKMQYLIAQLQNSYSVKFVAVETEHNSEEGLSLIAEYNITRIPTIIFPKKIADTNLLDWLSSFCEERNENNILTKLNPVYFDLATNTLREGKFNVVYISINSCKECYNVTIHKQILISNGMEAESELILDYETSEAKELINKYNITQLPAVILSPGASDYTRFSTDIWPAVGTIESDGYMIFRNNSVLNLVYYDLFKNQTIN